MVVIWIPYSPYGAQGRELELAIAGWRRHFMCDDYVIAVVGEQLPRIKGSDVVCIESPRVDEIPFMYTQHLDYVSCMKACHARFPDTDGIIFAADDNYLVRDITLDDVKALKYRDTEMNVNPACGGWRYDQYRTRQLLDREGLPHINYTTHVPCWFLWDRLEELWARYDMEHESYVIENLYYNTYHAGEPAIQCGEVKFQLCAPDQWREVTEQMKVKTWICNSPDGYTKELERILVDYYGLY